MEHLCILELGNTKCLVLIRDTEVDFDGADSFPLKLPHRESSVLELKSQAESACLHEQSSKTLGRLLTCHLFDIQLSPLSSRTCSKTPGWMPKTTDSSEL